MHGKFGYCTTCGPKSTSQWRKVRQVHKPLTASYTNGSHNSQGPQGAKTLCNPCGLQWWKSKTLRVADPSVKSEEQKVESEAPIEGSRQAEGTLLILYH